MSNAMRLGKRSLAGVAAGALALGMLSIAGATSSSAAPSIKPKVTLNNDTASVAPVRYSTTSSVRDVVYGAPLMLSLVTDSDDTPVTADDTIRMTLTGASATAGLWLNRTSGEPTGPGNADDTLTLAAPTTDDTTLNAVATGTKWFYLTDNADDSILESYIGVSEAGTYSGTIKVFDAQAPTGADDSVIINATFSFTTAGKPTEIVLDPTTLAMVASVEDTKTVTVSAKDSTGALTQLDQFDTIAVTSGTTSVATISAGAAQTAASFDDTTATVLGTSTFKVTATATAGASTVTATPAGTISTLAKPTVAVTTTGQGTTPPTALTLTAPTSQVLPVDDSDTDDTQYFYFNPALVSSFTIEGTGATASAGQTVVVTPSTSITGFKVGGVTIGSSATSVLVQADASGKVSIGGSWTPAALTQGTAIDIVTGNNTSKSKGITLVALTAAPDWSTTPAGSIVQKTGEATSFAVSLVDNFGNPLVGYRVTGKAGSGSSSAVGTTDASGNTTISVPAPSATYTGNATVVFTVLTPGGSAPSSGSLANATINYSASGDVTSVSVAVAGGASTPCSTTSCTITTLPYVFVPYDGTADDSGTGVWTIATATGTAVNEMALFTPTTVPANAVTVTAPEGVKLSKTKGVLWSGGSSTLTVASGTAVYAFATKTGDHEVTFTSGTKSVTTKFRATTAPAAAYNIAVTPAKQDLATGAIGSATLKVTDVFGNAVAGTSKDDTGGVTVTATGEILLAGYNSTINLGTDANGEARIVIIAGNAAGIGNLALTPAKKSNAWATGYVPPSGAPAPVTSAAAEVSVTSSAAKSIVITGSRTTVKGKPGIQIDGVTTGIENGKTVIPYFRFPGQTSYSQGTARPVITDGTFEWLRKTGKKFYAYVTNDDGLVQSNRVIIQAK